MLMEKSITRRTKWSSLKKQLEDDERYKAVDRSSSRESLFREYQDTLPEESNSVMQSLIFVSVKIHIMIAHVYLSYRGNWLFLSISSSLIR